VVTTSAGLADLVEEAFGRRPKVVLNAHDPRMDEPVIDIRRTLSLVDDDFLVVVPGNDKRGAATAEAIEAMRSLPESVHLAFVGGRYDGRLSRIRALGLGDRIRVLDPVPPQQFSPFIATADVALIPYVPLSPSYRHAIGNRFFVPIAAGVPVLYPRELPDLATLASAHEVGLEVDPRNPDDVVEAIRRLLGDPGLVSRLRKNASKAAAALSWESEERILEGLVAAALRDRPG
jgi:glycosyltransferase involved in cell wall biosynthesis